MVQPCRTEAPVRREALGIVPQRLLEVNTGLPGVIERGNHQLSPHLDA